MLNNFETWLAGSLRASLPESTKLVAGPMLPPAPADTPLLNVAVVSLRRRRSKPPADDEERRDAVQLTQTVTMNGDGLRIDFPLEKGTVSRILEIMTAPGRLARRGEFKNNLNSYVGLSLQFSIFSSLRTKTQISLAKINKEQSEVRQKNTNIVLKAAIDQAKTDMAAADERYLILQEQVQDYTASFKIATVKFEKGAITTVDYVIAKSNNDKAQMNFIAAKYDYILKSKVLDYYNG